MRNEPDTFSVGGSGVFATEPAELSTPATTPAGTRVSTHGVVREGTLDQARAPYAEALRHLADQLETGHLMRISVPGHLSDATLDVGSFYGADLLRLDMPPLTDGLDADPAGGITPLDEARHLAAQAWGAHSTWFLTGGASQGNLIACLALRSAAAHVPDDANLGTTSSPQIAVQRTVHSSVMDGMTMAGIDPVAVMPPVDAQRGMAHGLTPDLLADALVEHPNVLAAYVVSPSYFGAVSDIAGLAEVAHRHGVPLVVDEAWGAHLGFHPQLPVNALRLGADLVISSTHKLGGSLGQSAMLHLGHGPWADQLGDHIERTRRMVTSTSESALLTASLDLARRQLATGAQDIAESIAQADLVRTALRDDPRFTVISDVLVDVPAVYDCDPLRLVIDTRGTGLTGHQVRHLLFHDEGIQVEMSTDALIVALIAAGSNFDAMRFIRAMQRLPQGTENDITIHELPAPGQRVMSLREATFAQSEIVSAADSIGRISADSMAAYPPGVPNALPGEVITAETIAFLQASARAPHGYVRGAFDPEVTQVRVLRINP